MCNKSINQLFMMLNPLDSPSNLGSWWRKTGNSASFSDHAVMKKLREIRNRLFPPGWPSVASSPRNPNPLDSVPGIRHRHLLVVHKAVCGRTDGAATMALVPGIRLPPQRVVHKATMDGATRGTVHPMLASHPSHLSHGVTITVAAAAARVAKVIITEMAKHKHNNKHKHKFKVMDMDMDMDKVLVIRAMDKEMDSVIITDKVSSPRTQALCNAPIWPAPSRNWSALCAPNLAALAAKKST
jgi:hypothetical protein